MTEPQYEFVFIIVGAKLLRYNVQNNLFSF